MYRASLCRRHVLYLDLIAGSMQYYQLFSVDASFGYNWKESISKEHDFSLLSITFAHLANTTQKFNDLLNANPLLKKSFEQQFIIGENYSFTYNDQLEKEHKNHLYFKGSIDLSGTCCSLCNRYFTSKKRHPILPMKSSDGIFSVLQI